jgi:hypothetical protein
MGAGGLRRDLRRKGKLARGQGAAVEKRRHHGSSRRVSDQRSNFGDDRACNHFRYLTPKSVDEHFDGEPPARVAFNDEVKTRMVTPAGGYGSLGVTQ